MGLDMSIKMVLKADKAKGYFELDDLPEFDIVYGRKTWSLRDKIKFLLEREGIEHQDDWLYKIPDKDITLKIRKIISDEFNELLSNDEYLFNSIWDRDEYTVILGRATANMVRLLMFMEDKIGFTDFINSLDSVWDFQLKNVDKILKMTKKKITFSEFFELKFENSY